MPQNHIQPTLSCQDTLLLMRGWNPDILIPDFGMGLNEVSHHLDALAILQDAHLYTFGREKLFGPFESEILADDHFWNPVEQAGPRAHDARAESAHQDQAWPISAAACVANANYFGVSSGIAGLNSQVVAARDDPARGIGQD